MMETTTLDASPVIIDWIELVKQSREKAKENKKSEICSLLPALKDLLDRYNSLLENYENVPKEEKKKTILNVRAALRLALTWSSTDEIDLRNQILCEAVIHLDFHQALFRLLASRKGDSKSRTLASQLLSNLVTSHTKAAQAVTSSLPLSPSEESVTERIRQQLAENETPPQATEIAVNHPLCWVDVMLSCAHAANRDALAGVVAALHNAIVSLQEGDQVNEFARRMAQDSALVNTLLRHVISVQSIKQTVDGRATNPNETPHDASTEWIALLLVQCCRLGLLPDLMSSICGRCENSSTASNAKLVPEHIVLLHCIQSEVESSSSKDGNILGDEYGTTAVGSTHIFLANLYKSLRDTVEMDNLHVLSMSDEPEDALKFSAIVSTIDILACSLGQDSDAASSARSILGATGSSLIQHTSRDLGALMDSVSARNKGKKNREFIIHEEEKRFMTSLVRLTGNLCFHCRQNQDLVRQTSVPPPIHEASSSAMERNGLHVLLSCTSLSHACFTLREWAVIAIRNLLDKNELNQEEVAKLEANEPVQSAELASLGIKVDLDSKGNVSVLPSVKE